MQYQEPLSQHFIFIVTYNVPNKLEYLSLASISSLLQCYTLAY